MGWLFNIIRTIVTWVVNIVASVITNAITGSGGGGGWTGSGGGGHGGGYHAPTPEEIERERVLQEQIRHQQEISRKTKAFDKDLARSLDQPSKFASGSNQVLQGAINLSGSQQRPMRAHGPNISELGVQKALLTPVNPYLYLWAEPEAHRVQQILEHTPGIVDAALRVRPTPREAFDWLLARSIGLTNEEITALLEMHQKKKLASWNITRKRVNEKPDETVQARDFVGEHGKPLPTKHLPLPRAKLDQPPKPPKPSRPPWAQYTSEDSMPESWKSPVWAENLRVEEAFNTMANKGLERLCKANPSKCEDTKAQFLEGAFNENGTLNTKKLAKNMEKMFGYKIEYGDPDPNNNERGNNTLLADTDKGKILTLNVLDTSLHITAKAEAISPGSGLRTFRHYFSRTSDGRVVTIYLGADDKAGFDKSTGLHDMGKVPRFATNELDKMYLGSDMDGVDIGHEFFHQLDRHENRQGVTHFRAILKKYGLAYDRYKHLDSWASIDNDYAEQYADYGRAGIFNKQGYSGTQGDKSQNNQVGFDPLYEEQLDQAFYEYFSEKALVKPRNF